MANTRVHGDTGEIALAQQLVQLVGTKSALHKDDDLVELEVVQELVQLTVLLLLAELDIVLLQTVESELGIIVNVYLERVPHELLADGTDLLGKGGAEHHDLLVGRSRTENFLDVAAHVWQAKKTKLEWIPSIKNSSLQLTNLVEHLVTLIKNKSLDVAQGQLLVANQRIQATGSGDNDVGISLLVGQYLHILLDGGTSVEDCSLDIGQIFRETRILVLDLVSQLTSVAHDEDGALARNGLQLVQSGQDEDRSLTKTRLGLAENVDIQNRSRDANLLDCG